MTPQEAIEDRMLTLWGGRNIARLARESGVPRESISKILGYKRGIGDEVASKLAEPLNLPIEALLPPAAEVVSLASLDRRLQSLSATVDSAGRETAKALRALTRAIERLERRLDDEAPGAMTGG